MFLLAVLILGIVEGITEFLPISSTGHLILASSLLRIPQTEFMKSFEIAIQLGAIFSVVVLYGKSLIEDRATLRRVFVAFLPTSLIGFICYKAVKSFLLGNERVVLWSLLIGGVLILIIEGYARRKFPGDRTTESLTYRQAFLIGVFQSIAIVPGVSRSAATIMGGLLLGLGRKTIVEFSFVLSIPTMLAAAGYDLLKSGGTFSAGQYGYLFLGFTVSFITAMGAVKFLLSFIRRHTFITFGIYRIILAGLFFLAVRGR